MAERLGAGFAPVRKPGKLPAPVVGVEYALEYGTDRLEMHVDAFAPGARVLAVDDVLATGGTARATCDLIRRAGGEVAGCAFFVELAFPAWPPASRGPARGVVVAVRMSTLSAMLVV